jgi:3-deoxy-manno-octulosonate cytidylyltransferase (CMP-KDO synthetase)
MITVALIPARHASSRFPGKPLAPILGKPMIWHVHERACLIPGVALVAVATDSLEIASVVKDFGGKAIMTDPGHPSGSDRLAEAARILRLDDDDIVINVQGDQPALDPRHPALLAEALKEGRERYVMSTLAIPFWRQDEVADPNHVKVVIAQDGTAIYFSRSPIPYAREGLASYLKHVGIYAYRAGFLQKYVELGRGELEIAESLEQLRVLEHGFRIKVVLDDGLSPEVDVPSDLAKAERALSSEMGL